MGGWDCYGAEGSGGGRGHGEELRIFFAAMRGLTLIAKIKHEQVV